MTFSKLQNQILEYANEFPSLRNNLMSILYRFLKEGIKEIAREQSLVS